MQITLRPPPGATPTQIVAPGVTWLPGKLLTAKIVSVQDGEVRLLIAGQEHLVAWPVETALVPGSNLLLQVLGYSRGQWLLELVKNNAHTPLVSLLEVLERAGLPITYRNLLAMRRAPISTKVHPSSTDEQEGAICPWDKSLLQQLVGWEGILMPAMMIVDPFPLGLFDVKQRDAFSPSAVQQPWLLAVQLDALGQVEVIGQGEWPKQVLTFVAREETVSILKKNEEELRGFLSSAGVVLESLTYRSTPGAIVQLIGQELLSAAGVDISL